MIRIGIVVSLVTVCSLLPLAVSLPQASKQLDERAKKVATPQQENWKQVDEINKETDKTKARYQQAQQRGTQPGQKSVLTVKKSAVASGNAYKKPSPPGKKTSPKKK